MPESPAPPEPPASSEPSEPPVSPAVDRLLTPNEVRVMFGVAPSTLRRWDVSGRLRSERRTRGGHRRYRESKVRAALAEDLNDAADESEMAVA